MRATTHIKAIAELAQEIKAHASTVLDEVTAYYSDVDAIEEMLNYAKQVEALALEKIDADPFDKG